MKYIYYDFNGERIKRKSIDISCNIFRGNVKKCASYIIHHFKIRHDSFYIEQDKITDAEIKSVATLTNALLFQNKKPEEVIDRDTIISSKLNFKVLQMLDFKYLKRIKYPEHYKLARGDRDKILTYKFLELLISNFPDNEYYKERLGHYISSIYVDFGSVIEDIFEGIKKYSLDYVITELTRGTNFSSLEDLCIKKRKCKAIETFDSNYILLSDREDNVITVYSLHTNYKISITVPHNLLKYNTASILNKLRESNFFSVFKHILLNVENGDVIVRNFLDNNPHKWVKLGKYINRIKFTKPNILCGDMRLSVTKVGPSLNLNLIDNLEVSVKYRAVEYGKHLSSILTHVIGDSYKDVNDLDELCLKENINLDHKHLVIIFLNIEFFYVGCDRPKTLKDYYETIRPMLENLSKEENYYSMKIDDIAHKIKIHRNR